MCRGQCIIINFVDVFVFRCGISCFEGVVIVRYCALIIM